MRLDEKDQGILRILQMHGRISNKDLAARVGLSCSACFERVRRLERARIIRGYHAQILPCVAPAPFETWANVVLFDLPKETQEAFFRLVTDTRNIVRAYNISGAFDYLLHFVGDDALAWKTFSAQLTLIGIGANRISFGIVVSIPK